MYRKIEPALRMTVNESSVKYPDEHILILMDSKNLSNDMGTVLYTGDDGNELFSLVMKLDDPSLYRVVEGLNHLRSLGGIVVGV
jgi:hypothetical protein